MKKKYSTPNLIKAVSLSAAMATLLSSVSPVFAANFAFTGGANLSTSGAGVSYPRGSHGSVVLAGDDDYCGVDNVIGRGGKQQENLNNKITAKQEFENFIVDQADNIGRNPYGTTTDKVTWQSSGVLTSKGAYMGTNTGGSPDIRPEAFGVYSFVTGCGAAATGNYSTAFGAGATTKAGGAQAFGVAALASGKASVAMGVSSEAAGEAAVAVGGLATASGDRSISIGVDSKAKASGSIAIGSRRSNRTGESSPTREVVAEARNAIAIGTHTYGKGEDSVAIGANAQALVNDGVAVGGASVSRREKGDNGYDPATGKMTTKTDATWKSTAGAFSVGDVGQEAGNGKITRQITGVAAGKEDTDAVNVAQLKAISAAASGAWKLSANDKSPTDVNPGSTIDFSVKSKKPEGKDNLTIVKKTTNNKHKIEFTLNDHLKLTQVTTGQSTMIDDGFFVNGQNGSRMTVDGFFVNGQDGPNMTVDGIDAGNQKITRVADGVKDTDAVNYKQLKEVKEAAKTHWQLTVNGQSPMSIGQNDTVNFAAAGNESNRNIKIVGDDNRNVTFDLADNINVMSVTAGESIMDAAGFRFDDDEGPSITVTGIHAGDKTIKGVADGGEDTDAVNYKQLKDVKQIAEKGWKLSVDGENATDVGAGSTVDLVSAENKDGSKNIAIKKDDKNKVTFTLNDNLKLTSVTTGNSIMSNDGFKFVDGNGPEVTLNGIHAGNKKITGVSEGKENTDAVNYKQLNEVKTLAQNGWKLSVDGKDPTDVKAGNTVDLIAGETRGVRNKNIIIKKDSDNQVTFSLVDQLTLTSVTTGNSIMSGDGFGFVVGGPKITTNGIDAGNKKITKVLGGTDDTDAVNYKQLKALEQVATQGWKLSVDGNNATDVKAGDTVDLVAAEHKDKNGKEDGTTNIKIVKGEGNKVSFDLGEVIKVGDVVTGKSHMADNGFIITDGPRMTTGGIHAGNKIITGVQKGTNANDAVNVSQLNEIKDQIVENSLVKWDENERLITIGKEKGGTKIDITGTDGGRTIAGVRDGEISEESHEAINGSQINKISKDVAKFFGGGTEFNNGEFSGPKYVLSHVSTNGTVERKEFENVGDALTGLDANVKNVNSRLTYVTNDFNQKFDKFSQDALLWSDAKQAFVALHKKGDETTESKITSLLNGDITEDSTDAINGSQIHSIGSNIAKFFGGNNSFENGIFTGPEYELKIIEEDGPIAIKRYDNVGSALDAVNTNVFAVDHRITVGFLDIADYFGGGAKYEKGKWQAPTFKVYKINADGSVSQQPYDNVADAFEGVNNTFTNIHNQISDIKENNLVQQEEKSGPITIGAKTGGGIINIANNEGSVRIISGVSGGKITEDSTEAVNGAQLFETNGAIQNLYDNFDNMNTNISNYFGGNADVLNGVAPTYVIQGNKHNDVGSAFSAVDTSITNIHNQISDITKNSLVKWDETNKFITIGAEKDGVEINISNKDEKPRVISGVREGLYDDEAVNVAQLKEVKELAKNGWKLSVNGDEDNVTDVKAGSTVDFSVKDTSKKGVGKDNLKIEKDDKNKVTFSLNDNLKLTSVTTDNSTMSDDGFIIKNGPHMTKDGIFVNDNNGPSMTMEGIDAGKKVITNVAEGKNDTDAVNFSQLQGIKNQIENDSLVKWEEEKKLITIGKEKGGTEIRIANKDGKERILSGVKDGMISQASKEAINGSQINKISEDIAKFFGGGAKFVDGAFKGLKYTLSAIVDGQVGKANFYDVGSALTGLDKNVQDVNQRLTKVSNEFNQTIEGISKDALLWDDEEEAFVARHEKDGKKTNSKLKYLLDGNIAEGSTDAITGNQLYLMSNKLANYFGGGAGYKDGKWTDPTFKISKVDENGKTVETEHNNVADAFGDINTGMSNINNRINDVINKVDTDALKWNENKKAYDANRDGKPSKITGVADGKIAEGSKEAVNGGQLWKTNERVTNVENRVTDVENHVTIIDKKVDNISNTIEDIGDTVNNINVKVDNIDNKVNDIAEDAVRYDRDENGRKTNKITLAGGDASEPVLIDNVADGKIEKGSKEAVNGGQLHDYTKEQTKLILDESKHYTDQRIRNITIDAIDDAVERAKQYTDMRFDVLNYSIESVKKEARQAAAIGLAVSNLRYNDTPGKLSVGFGAGLWRSQSAFAFGAGYTSEDGKYRSNISATTSGGHWGVGAGFNMTLN